VRARALTMVGVEPRGRLRPGRVEPWGAASSRVSGSRSPLRTSSGSRRSSCSTPPPRRWPTRSRRARRISVTGSAERTALFARNRHRRERPRARPPGAVRGPLLSRVGTAATLAILPAVTGSGFSCSRPARARHARRVPGGEAGDPVRARAAGARDALHDDRPSAKYKAKSFIDTVVFRGGDAASIWSYSGSWDSAFRARDLDASARSASAGSRLRTRSPRAVCVSRCGGVA